MTLGVDAEVADDRLVRVTGHAAIRRPQLRDGGLSGGIAGSHDYCLVQWR
jgi:hypothetical protein